MSLAATLSKAKAEMADAAARNITHARPSTVAGLSRTATPRPIAGHKREHESAFASPAATTPLSAGQAGGELLTNVVTAVRYLKEKESRLVAFDDLIGYLSLPNDLQKNIPRIKMALEGHDRVDFIPKSASPNGRDSFKYRPKHPVTNVEELREYLARQPTAQYIPVNELKDGWPDCAAAINQLEADGWALVKRFKDGTPRCVWSDSPTYHILDLVSGKPQHADGDFVDFWTKTKLPASEMEIRTELEKAGLTPTSQVKEIRRAENRKKEKRRINRKGGKTTNSHMMGILKDYTQGRK